MRWSDESARALERAGLTADEALLEWFGHRLRQLSHGRDTVPVAEIHHVLELAFELYPEEIIVDIGAH